MVEQGAARLPPSIIANASLTEKTNMQAKDLAALTFTCAMCMTTQASAITQDPPTQADPVPDSVVTVKAIRDPDWKPYSAMLKGVRRFKEMRDLAPTAELQFILIPRRSHVDMNALQLRLQSEEASLEIPLKEGNIFSLPVEPELAQNKAELMLNRKAGSVRWIPYVRSATTTNTLRRLGDLRLTCEVHWAIDKETLPFAARMAIGALGGPCEFVSKKGTYSFSEPRRIVGATISFEGKSEPVPVDGFSFTPPLREKRWGNDSVIALQFEEPPPAKP